MRDFPACLDALLAHLEGQLEGEGEWVRGLVNHQDSMGCSSLHIATQFWPEQVSLNFITFTFDSISTKVSININISTHTVLLSQVVTRLLHLGANIGLANSLGDLPVSHMLASTLESFLDRACLSSQGSPTNTSYSITLDFTVLAPPTRAREDTEAGLQVHPHWLVAWLVE